MLRDLTYKVIVIDDDPDLYEDYIEEIEAILKEQGYLLEHDRYEEIDELEEKTGIDFFPNLNDNLENALEATYSTKAWPGLE